MRTETEESAEEPDVWEAIMEAALTCLVCYVVCGDEFFRDKALTWYRLYARHLCAAP